MGSNSFGKIFTVTTWGESHGRAIGVVIDGCPSGIAISEDEIRQELLKRAPGRSAYTSCRRETEQVEILSGVFQGITTGAPICLQIANQDGNSSFYQGLEQVLRPGHASFTYWKKYRNFDPRGGGRSSGRETACRVAAGCIAKKILSKQGVECSAFLQKVGDITVSEIDKKHLEKSAIFCPDPHKEEEIKSMILTLKEKKDSVGAVVYFEARGVPVGWGDPVYEKLEANLAKAMLSIPASKGFEIGEGFSSCSMQGSLHNDLFSIEQEEIVIKTNHAGGILGGISTGMPIYGRVAFKPTSTILQPVESVTTSKQRVKFCFAPDARHDPCVGIRAVVVVEAMLALVLVDAFLLSLSN